LLLPLIPRVASFWSRILASGAADAGQAAMSCRTSLAVTLRWRRTVKLIPIGRYPMPQAVSLR